MMEVLEAQIAFVLKQAEDGTRVGEVCRKTGVSGATFYAGARSSAIDNKTPISLVNRAAAHGPPLPADAG